MLKGPFLDRTWMGQNPDYDTANIIMLGLPFDGTVSYRSGSRFAPEQIRLASWGLEEYSPRFDKDINDCNFHDIGDLEFPLGNTVKSLELIKDNVKQIYDDGKRLLGIGGEHLVTYPEIVAISDVYGDDLAIVHFDAHTDLRDEYMGEKLSHSAVIKLCSSYVRPENIKQIGIRSGMKEEWEFMKRNNTFIKDNNDYKSLDCLLDKKVFITVDLDVLDPSVMSGTGTPESGGMSFNELMGWFEYLKKFDIIGADVVELAPDYDTSGCSTAVATKVIRELLMIM
ncbi:TPA: agmatinase [Candidatus Gastranaerophilales bacterium HUM_9]|nr:MAG TPA: agmatinase [Candidatus Gastranaerophilales bacterium HUM_9]HBX34321.1 agmatinase [Cyanobacteria bacterium UBA11440]